MVPALGLQMAAKKLRYTYDALRQFAFKIDANNQQTSYTYDGLHRVLSSTDAIGQIQF